jgi:release factor glutamine methyltransferase
VEPWTIGRLLDTVAAYLKEKGSESGRLDAELLLADTLDLERIDLYTQHDRPLTPEELGLYRAFVARRAAHEPVAYIRGRAYFRHLRLEVRPGVLIPRPETEELVDLALDILRRRPAWGDLRVAGAEATATSSASSGLPTVVDVGTGSGAIALSLAQEAGVRVLAVDDSAEALAIAEANAASLGLEQLVVLRPGDLLAGLRDGTLDLVVSNPPYVRSVDIPSLAADVRLFEPLAALDGGADGLDAYRRLVPAAAGALRPGGTLLLEVGDGQAAAVAGLAAAAGFVLVAVHKDLSRKDRMVEATLPGAPTLSPADLGQAEAQALRTALDAGAIIGVPTDTVYGLAARWDLPAGIRRLFAAKRRPPEQPVAVLFPSVATIRAALPDLEPHAAGVLAALLPGPYTFVVTTRVPRPELVGTADSLGVRMPDHPDLLRLLAAIDVPVAATSANLSGLPDAATAEQVDPLVLAHCSLAVIPAGLIAGHPRGPAGARGAAASADGAAGGTVAPNGAGTPGGTVAPAAGVASTVVDLRPLSEGGEAIVLREGAVSGEEVLRRIHAVL